MIAAILYLDEGPRLAVEACRQMAGGLGHRHDVVYRYPFLSDAAPAFGLQLLGIADDAADLGHGGEGGRVDLGGAAGDDDPGIGPVAAGAADRLAGLALGFRRHGAGIDDNRIGHARGLGVAAHHLGFISVEPAAESQDIDGWESLPAHAAAARCAAPDNSPSSISPMKLVAAGPVMIT